MVNLEHAIEIRTTENLDVGDALTAASTQLDALQARCTEAIDAAKKAQASVVATQQLLNQHIARVRGLLVQAGNARKSGSMSGVVSGSMSGVAR